MDQRRRLPISPYDGLRYSLVGVYAMMARTDTDGVTVGDALDAIHYRGSDEVSPSEIKAYFEPHIEQGPISKIPTPPLALSSVGLGRSGSTPSQGLAHAGPTPTNLRRVP